MITLMKKSKLIQYCAILQIITACQNPSNHSNLIEQQVQNILQYSNKENQDQAIEAMTILQKKHPKQPLITSALGYLYEQNQQPQLSYQAYLLATTLEPKNATWHNNLGIYLCKKNHYLRGIKKLAKAKTLALPLQKHYIKENIKHCLSLQKTHLTTTANKQTPTKNIKKTNKH
jgi:Tfp pilus assembly protein PilF